MSKDYRHQNEETDSSISDDDDDVGKHKHLLADDDEDTVAAIRWATSRPTLILAQPKKDVVTTDDDDVDGGKNRITYRRSRTSSAIKSRTVLWYLTFIGFAINYMIRINMNITIVDMIRLPTAAVGSVARIEPECFRRRNDDFVRVTNFNESSNDDEVEADVSVTFMNGSDVLEKGHVGDDERQRIRYSVERWIMDKMKIKYDGNGFDWDERRQGLLLGSFFWLHWVTQIPGGVLARRYGTKLIFGVTNLVGCLMCLVMPIVAYVDYNLLITLRVVQGLICGLAWPAMHSMTSKWIPPNERSKFVTAYLGSSVGVALFYPLFGFIISISSWEWVYYVCGALGIVWFASWQYFVYDSPAQHPRCDPAERDYIETSLGTSVQQTTKNASATPWRAILTSRAVWVIGIAQWGGVWGLFTLMTQAPTYFKFIHGLNMNMTGILSGAPHLLRMGFAYAFSVLGDWLLSANRMSRTNVRKLAGIMCLLVNGAFVVGLAYTGCNSTAAIAMLMAATAVHGAVSTGPLASLIDISPNYSGITLGLTGMFAVLPGFISPLIVGHLTLNNQTIEQWKYVFLIAAAMLIGCGFIYLFFSESNLQSWNQATPLDHCGSTTTDEEFQKLAKYDNLLQRQHKK